MRDELGRFAPGSSGNPAGRPKGARQEFSEAFLNDLCRHWQENGAQAIDATFKEKPDVYLRIAASLIPKNIEHSGSEDSPVTPEVDDLELARRIAFLLTNAVSEIDDDSETPSS